MSMSRRIARSMLSSIFIFGGADAVRHPEGKVKVAEGVAQPIAKRIPGLPEDTELLVRINGAVQVGAGVALATGKFRRIAALALIGSVIPTTLAGHRFWEQTDEAAKAQQRLHFLKNLGLLGGLVLAAVDTEGAPSLGWRAKRRAKRASQTVAAGRSLVGAKVGKTRGRAARKANKAAAQASAVTMKGGGKMAKKAGKAAAKVGRQANQVDLKKAQKHAAKAAKHGIQVASPYLHSGADRAGELLSIGADRAGDLLVKAHDRLPVG
ncbi:MAG: DoxX family protein [Acidimicrobiales bacterium]